MLRPQVVNYYSQQRFFLLLPHELDNTTTRTTSDPRHLFVTRSLIPIPAHSTHSHFIPPALQPVSPPAHPPVSSYSSSSFTSSRLPPALLTNSTSLHISNDANGAGERGCNALTH
ncbi:hypothetical protein E2C01_007303 [Portunus trituberculatus]|uniref:Uncharacterized protein n=1 Tax=Portunus trituberculatus TaxID=210409 RepID=A0A5B7CZS3_PORTR|nr:hypothetical protein [Portunus trituberculatus]